MGGGRGTLATCRPRQLRRRPRKRHPMPYLAHDTAHNRRNAVSERKISLLEGGILPSEVKKPPPLFIIT